MIYVTAIIFSDRMKKALASGTGPTSAKRKALRQRAVAGPFSASDQPGGGYIFAGSRLAFSMSLK